MQDASHSSAMCVYGTLFLMLSKSPWFFILSKAASEYAAIGLHQASTTDYQHSWRSCCATTSLDLLHPDGMEMHCVSRR